MRELIIKYLSDNHAIIKRKDDELQPVIRIGGTTLTALTKSTRLDYDTMEEALEICKGIMEVSKSVYQMMVMQDSGTSRFWIAVRDYDLGKAVGTINNITYKTL